MAWEVEHSRPTPAASTCQREGQELDLHGYLFVLTSMTSVLSTADIGDCLQALSAGYSSEGSVSLTLVNFIRRWLFRSLLVLSRVLGLHGLFAGSRENLALYSALQWDRDLMNRA